MKYTASDGWMRAIGLGSVLPVLEFTRTEIGLGTARFVEWGSQFGDPAGLSQYPFAVLLVKSLRAICWALIEAALTAMHDLIRSGVDVTQAACKQKSRNIFTRIRTLLYTNADEGQPCTARRA
ncbi:hypothetical protein [Haloferax larsenii]|uniref:Uncharacterized protein n=1 Tax=Haloferax larsenii TaxID=302484 RepID=A0A1H7US26_HALLR|nr:hypothetical protein [Haloferax larsenii]SEL99790.1 hypothetical protein SAMN04488691_11414 [Haloferax larsenii]